MRTAIAFLPWLPLPACVDYGALRFVPTSARDAESVLGAELGTAFCRMASSYVDYRGQSIDTLTLVTTKDGRCEFAEDEINALIEATHMLALATLAEHCLLDGKYSYVNSRAFEAHFQFGVRNAEGPAPYVPRRVRSIQFLDGSWEEIRFQAPAHVMDVRPPMPDTAFLVALDRLVAAPSELCGRLRSALPVWLLANSDDPGTLLPTDKPLALALAAVAFEQLLGQPKGALGVAEAFSDRLPPDGSLILDRARRVKRDDKHVKAQKYWRTHKKWMKELYESRNLTFHGSPKPDLSRNWSPNEHLVAQAFCFPLLVKLLLASEGLYSLSGDDIGACKALDGMLDATDWGFGRRSQSNWPRLLAEARRRHGLEEVLQQKIEASLVARSDAAHPEASSGSN